MVEDAASVSMTVPNVTGGKGFGELTAEQREVVDVMEDGAYVGSLFGDEIAGTVTFTSTCTTNARKAADFCLRRGDYAVGKPAEMRTVDPIGEVPQVKLVALIGTPGGWKRTWQYAKCTAAFEMNNPAQISWTFRTFGTVVDE
jgi:hypothetical protein